MDVHISNYLHLFFELKFLHCFSLSIALCLLWRLWIKFIQNKLYCPFGFDWCFRALIFLYLFIFLLFMFLLEFYLTLHRGLLIWIVAELNLKFIDRLFHWGPLFEYIFLLIFSTKWIIYLFEIFRFMLIKLCDPFGLLISARVWEL